MFASVLQPLANARERDSLATERRPVRGRGPLGEDGCSSAARLVLGARAAGRYAMHTGLESASRPASPVISPPPRREPVTVRSSLVCASAGRAAAEVTVKSRVDLLAPRGVHGGMVNHADVFFPPSDEGKTCGSRE